MAKTKFNPQKDETGKYGYADINGKVIIPFEYDWICNEILREKFLWVEKEDKVGMIDLNNQVIIPFEYEKPIKFNNYSDFLTLRKSGKEGVLDFQGNVIIPFEYDAIFEKKWGGSIYFNVEKEKKWGLITAQGIKILSVIYDEIYYTTTDVDADGFEQIIFTAKKGEDWHVVRTRLNN